MTSRFTAILALMLGWMLIAVPVRAEQPSDRPCGKEIERTLSRAGTWYWWARASGNAEDYHLRSRRAYERARHAALQLPVEQQGPCLARAEAGIAQMDARVDNSWDNFRSVFSPVWWFLEADPTVEYADDAEMLAVSNAWEDAHSGIFGGVRVDWYWAVVRCSDCRAEGACAAIADPDGIGCQELRDELMIHLDRDSRLGAITDDRLRALLTDEDDYEAVIEAGHVPGEQLERLADALGIGHLLLLDLELIDEIEQEPGVLHAYRIDLASTLWDQDRGILSKVRSVGIGADAWSRAGQRVGWIGAMLATALLWALVWGLYRDREDDWRSLGQRGDDLLVAIACWTLGALVGWLAVRVSAGLLPDWGSTAISSVRPGLDLPRIEALRWPTAHGAVVLLGSISACSLLAPRVLPRIAARLRDNVDLGIVAVTGVAGALAILFAPIVQALPGRGWLQAAAFSSTALWVSAFTVPSLCHTLGLRYGRALHHGWGEDPRHPYLGVLLGFGTLLLLLPLGMFHGWVWVVCGCAIAMGGPLWLCRRPRKVDAPASQEDTGEPEEMRATRTNPLLHPAWTRIDGRDPEEAASWLAQAVGCRLMLLEGPASSGKTRFMEEIRARLVAQGGWVIGLAHGLKSTQESSAGVSATEAYDIVIQSMHSLGLGISSQHIQDRGGRGAALEAAFDRALSEMPGFGLIFDLTVSGQSEALSEHKIRNDMIKAIRSIARDRRLLLCLDDVQWADPSSIELLCALIRACNEDHREKERIAIIVTLWPEGPGATCEVLGNLRDLARSKEGTNVMVRRLEKRMTPEDTRSFLRSAGLTENAAKALTNDAGQYTRGRPGEMVDFVRALVSQGMLRQLDCGEYELTSPLKPEALARAIPASSKARYHHQLDSLDEATITLLECAALCGRVFSVEDVAAGLERTPMETVQKLRHIEDRYGLVTDPEEHEKCFAFTSAILQSALLERLYQSSERKGGKRNREHAKLMHEHIARSLIDRDQPGQALRIAMHCNSAGPQMAETCVGYAIQAAHQAWRRYAWREMREALELSKTSLASLPKGTIHHETEPRIAWLEACDLRRDADSGKKRRLAELLGPLVDKLRSQPDGWPEPWELVFAYLEASYDGRDDRKSTENRRRIATWTNDPAWGDSVARAFAGFYNILAEHENQPPEGLVNALLELEREVETLPLGRGRDQLMSMLLNKRAGTMTRFADQRFTSEDILGLFEKSNAIKEVHGDKRGVAMGLGGMANVFLTRKTRLREALALYQRDLDIILEMGFISDESFVRNKKAECLWAIAKQEKQQGASPDRVAAFLETVAAAQHAIDHERDGDLEWARRAAINYCSFLLQQASGDQLRRQHPGLAAPAEGLRVALQRRTEEHARQATAAGAEPPQDKLMALLVRLLSAEVHGPATQP